MPIYVRSLLQATILACGAAMLKPGPHASAQVNPMTLSRTDLSFSHDSLPFGPAGSVMFPRGKIWFSGGSFEFRTAAFGFSKSAIVFPVGPERVETPSTIELVLPADILFDYAKGDIGPTAGPELHEVAEIIRYSARCPVMIQGFTDVPGPDGHRRTLPDKNWLEMIEDFVGDSLGTDASNRRLSERVALSVKVWLETNERLAPWMLKNAGLGARDPVASNRRPDGSDDADGRRSNRRVKLIIPKLPGRNGDCA
jgi:outer membrane protein OmpA-like peptidoglycan-associated protein